ncbi:MAG: hypothetical protein Q7T66_00395 [Herminiimonas sp.]|uniref:hypothetical protein n=1 Tax=Herminiimonas sp. TaxID=1926289 RepID=UPI002725E855|nr:hypothetical protein [Herminiimonas sp.]MDO9419095.1 hypothetical protein [Herminiimonas sp.]
MTETNQAYIVQQRKMNPGEKDLPVYAKAMRSKEGVFEGVSFIRNREKASVMTLAEAQEAVAWAKKKKPLAGLYETSIIPAE